MDNLRERDSILPCLLPSTSIYFKLLRNLSKEKNVSTLSNSLLILFHNFFLCLVDKLHGSNLAFLLSCSFFKSRVLYWQIFVFIYLFPLGLYKMFRTGNMMGKDKLHFHITTFQILMKKCPVSCKHSMKFNLKINIPKRFKKKKECRQGIGYRLKGCDRGEIC